MDLTPKSKKERKQRFIDDKYELIRFYESIESKGRGAKEETRKKFDFKKKRSFACMRQIKLLLREYD